MCISLFDIYLAHHHQILVMKEGKIVEKGNHNSLINKKGEYFKLFESQVSENIVSH